LGILFKDFKNKSVNYYIDLKRKLKETHQKNLEIIKLNHLKKMNSLRSSFLERILEKSEIRNIMIKNLPNGGTSLIFVE